MDKSQKEIWKSISGYEGQYDVSSKGRVRSYWKRVGGRTVLCSSPQSIKSQRLSHHGYWLVTLSKRKTKKVHRLVLETFIGCCPKGMECCHTNGICTDNRQENLRWDTHKNNMVKDGGAKKIIGIGEKHLRAKLTNSDVFNIKEMIATHKIQKQKIAAMYHVSPATVSLICSGKTWKHIQTTGIRSEHWRAIFKTELF